MNVKKQGSIGAYPISGARFSLVAIIARIGGRVGERRKHVVKLGALSLQEGGARPRLGRVAGGVGGRS